MVPVQRGEGCQRGGEAGGATWFLVVGDAKEATHIMVGREQSQV